MTLSSPEFQRMEEVAKKYLAGDDHFMSLYYSISETLDAMVSRYGRDCLAAQIARNWLEIADRFRNEMGIASDPITEAEFQAWLKNQL